MTAPAGKTSDSPSSAAAPVGDPLKPEEPWGWTRGHQVALAALVAILLACLLIQYLRHPYRLDSPVRVVDGPPSPLEEAVDPNTAEWASLARLPGIGEPRAKAIVEYRQQHAERNPVFQTAPDLLFVRGIGRDTLHRARPFLRFPGDPPATLPARVRLIPPARLPESPDVEHNEQPPQ